MSLTNFEIDDLAKKYKVKNYRGCYSKDELKTLQSLPGKIVVNMEDSVDKKGKPLPGSHWVMVDIDPTKKRAVYMDPYGVFPPNEIVGYMYRSQQPGFYLTKQIEDADSSLCGWYCLYFMAENSRGRTYPDIASDFHSYPNTKLNYKIINSYFNIRGH